MVTVTYIVSGVVFFLWLPILRHFWKAWKSRKNPVSLAICAGILYFLYIVVNTPIFVQSDKLSVILAICVANLFVCIFFYASLRIAHLRWIPPNGTVRREEEASNDR